MSFRHDYDRILCIKHVDLSTLNPYASSVTLYLALWLFSSRLYGRLPVSILFSPRKSPQCHFQERERALSWVRQVFGNGKSRKNVKISDFLCGNHRGLYEKTRPPSYTHDTLYQAIPFYSCLLSPYNSKQGHFCVSLNSCKSCKTPRNCASSSKCYCHTIARERDNSCPFCEIAL